jgi:hypothetical protein
MPTLKNAATTATQAQGVSSLLLYCGLAHADSAQALRDYQNDRQRCLSGQTSPNQISCLQKASAVLEQPRSVQGSAPSGGNLRELIEPAQ